MNELSVYGEGVEIGARNHVRVNHGDGSLPRGNIDIHADVDLQEGDRFIYADGLKHHVCVVVGTPTKTVKVTTHVNVSFEK